MNMWQFCDAHPVWALIYLGITCVTAVSIVDSLTVIQVHFKKYNH